MNPDVSSIELSVRATPEQIYAVLADGWMYSGWVVGASHIRKVDDHWPQAGALIHHTVGVWPLTVKDTTSVIASEPYRLLELDARAFPVGRAHVRIELRRTNGGHTRIRMAETVSGGPSQLIPQPVVDPLLDARNRESLRRLCDIAVGRFAREAAAST